MTEAFKGLRFDIYERVHLPEDVAAIDTLEEIELVPHMQALSQEDQVLLRGHLLLSGAYKSKEDAEGTRQLEHWIPVEITLPQNRVQRVEDLGIEIDHFDVDLLSDRSLNVTGVLGLRGLHTPPQETPVWHEDSFTVVHQAPAEPVQESVHTLAESAQPFTEPPLTPAGPPRDSSFGTSQPAPVYHPRGFLSPEYASAVPEQPAPVWYDQQRIDAEQQAQARARAEAEAREAREQEQALARAQALEQEQARAWAEVQAQAAYEQAQLIARAEAEARAIYEQEQLNARAEAEARAAYEQQQAIFRQQEQERAQVEVAERLRAQQEQDAREEAEAWALLNAYDQLEDEVIDATPGTAFVGSGPGHRDWTPDEMEQIVTGAGGHAEPTGNVPSYYEVEVPLETTDYEALEADQPPQTESPREEKNGPKVGFGGKSGEPASAGFGVGILSQLGDKGARREAELRAANEAELAEQLLQSTKDSESTGDEIEWTRLFLAKDPEHSFRRVKLCIVQREDTLDAIADRYNLQSRELQLYNRLYDQHVAEGQVIYIP